MFGKFLSYIDGPIISRIVGAVVGALVSMITKTFILTPDQVAQIGDALTTFLTIIGYAIAHNGIKLASSNAGNEIVRPAGASTEPTDHI